MAMTTLPKKAVIAPWMAFALALAMLAVTTGQPEMAVPLSTRLASAALARDADRQREITSWREQQGPEFQKTEGVGGFRVKRRVWARVDSAVAPQGNKIQPSPPCA